MKLSIIMPVFNEKTNILKIISRVKKSKIGRNLKEIIIVDDFSNDGTREILKNLKDNDLKILFHTKNLGKSSSIRTALPHVTGDIVIIQDADLEYDPNDYYSLLAPFKDEKVLVVYGSRDLGKRVYHYKSFYFGVKFLTHLANFLYGVNITDEATCYKLFRTKLLKSLNLKCTRFEFCPEVTAKIGKRNIKIHEVGISYNPRKFEEGKKIKFKDGIQAAWVLFKYKFID